MNKEIAERIELIKQGKVPKGYKKVRSGIIPNEWTEDKLRTLISELEGGVSVNSDEGTVDERNFGVLKAGCVLEGIFKPQESKKIKANEIVRAKVNPKKGRIIVSRANTPELVGSVGLVDEDYNNLFLSDKLWQTDYLVELDSRWLTNVLSSVKIRNRITLLATGTSRSMQNISKESFLSLKILIPSYKEQCAIKNKLLVWDKAIELKEKLLKEKQKQKQGLMSRLLTGKVRLSGFDKAWNKIKINKILKVRDEKSEVTKELELYSLTIQDGVTPKSDRYNREFLVKDDDKKYKITKYNDIVYNPANLRYGAIALNKIELDVLLSPIYETLYIQDNNKYDIKFIASILTSQRQIRKFSTMAEGTLVERMAVKIKDFTNFNISIPSDINEQKAIAKIISISQKEIDLLREQIEAIKQQKKGLTQLLLTGIIRVKCD